MTLSASASLRLCYSMALIFQHHRWHVHDEEYSHSIISRGQPTIRGWLITVLWGGWIMLREGHAEEARKWKFTPAGEVVWPSQKGPRYLSCTPGNEFNTLFYHEQCTCYRIEFQLSSDQHTCTNSFQWLSTTGIKLILKFSLYDN